MTGSVLGQARGTPTPIASASRDNQPSETAALKKEISVLTDVKLKLNWYPRGEFYPFNSKEQSLTQCLSPSRWNSVEVILPNTKADELGSISVAMETKTVSFVCRN